jgi:hypothetical protein
LSDNLLAVVNVTALDITFLACDRTIGRTVDSGIGENPISRDERRLKNLTSNLAEARVIDADEQKR